METKHTETVVEKAVAYVKDMLGLRPGDKSPWGEASRVQTVSRPVVRTTPHAAGPTSDDAMRLDPDANGPHLHVPADAAPVAEANPERHTNNAVDEHMQAAAKIDHARRLVGEALGEIDDISRGMRGKIVDEKSPSYNDAAEHGGKKMPSESEMQQADECARDADRKEKNREAEQESVWRLPVL